MSDSSIYEHIKKTLTNAKEEHAQAVDNALFGSNTNITVPFDWWGTDVSKGTVTWWRNIKPNEVEHEVNDVQDVDFS